VLPFDEMTRGAARECRRICDGAPGESRIRDAMNDVTLVLSIAILPPAAIFLALPRLTPRGYYFGIAVPPRFPQTEPGRGIRRGYLLAVAIAFALGLALGVAVPQAVAAAVLLPIFASAGAFFYARHHVKLHSAPSRRPPQAVAEAGRESLPAWTLLALPPFAVPAVIAARLRSNWDRIPARFPVHWGWDGQPNRWAERTPHSVYGPLWFSAGMMALMAILAVVMFYGSRRSPLRIAVLKIMIGVEYLLAWIIAVVGLLPLVRFSPAALMLPIAIFVGALLAYLFKLSADPDIPTDATPDECWHLSAIYYNPGDPSLFVQQRIGLGYTLNLGNPASWVLLGVTLAAIPLAILLLR
jgi:uncharacterized membrane protein